MAPEIPTPAEPNPTPAPEIPIPAEPISTPTPEIPTLVEPISTPKEGSVEMRHLDLDSEDPATDLNPRRRQSGKRKASFSPGRPTPKIPRVVAYVDSSSDEGEGEVGKNAGMTPPQDQIKGSAGGSTVSPRATTSARLPGTCVRDSGPSN